MLCVSLLLLCRRLLLISTACCSHGPFENYGEMLYAEGLEAAAVKNSRVGA